ncbi:hypothetical protein TcWFU_001259 [Taenia crassiceps]|uniref:Uncharacterized protein n=1 Tax=Taenia crassiceps TaxID=6207 RepID=A0ABR4QGL6_9CEST
MAGDGHLALDAFENDAIHTTSNANFTGTAMAPSHLARNNTAIPHLDGFEGFTVFDEHIPRCHPCCNTLGETSDPNPFESKFINVGPTQQPGVERDVPLGNRSPDKSTKSRWVSLPQNQVEDLR